MKNKNGLLKKIIFVAVLIYAIITFINQQKILNNYTSQLNTIKVEIAEAKEQQAAACSRGAQGRQDPEGGADDAAAPRPD